jgi:hypothetical protein
LQKTTKDQQSTSKKKTIHIIVHVNNRKMKTIKKSIAVGETEESCLMKDDLAGN